MDYQKLRKKYQSELEKLSPFTRKALENASLLSFDSFYEHVFTYQSVTDFFFLRGCGDLCKKEMGKLVKKVFSSGTDYKSCRKEFRSGLKKLNPSALSTLDSDCLLFFETFFDKFYVRKNTIDQIRVRNCRPVYRKAVQEFVDSMCRSLEASGAPRVPYYLGTKLPEKRLPEKLDKKNTSFWYLDHYLNEPGRLKPLEKDIYRHYFCFVQGFKKKNLTEIAKRHKVTRERVRQRSIMFSQVIIKKIKYLIEGQSLNFEKYFCKDYFLINKESALVINQLENTKFSPDFIALVLSVSLGSNYDILTMSKDENTSASLFIKKSIPVDFIEIKSYLEGTIKSDKLRKNKIQIKEMFSSYHRGKNNPVEPSDVEKDLSDILGLIINGISYKNFRIEANSSVLTFKLAEKDFVTSSGILPLKQDLKE